VDAPDAHVQRFAVRGSGADLGGPDAGVFVGPRSVRAIVSDLSIEDCAFGIWVHETRAVRVTGNRIQGRTGQHPSNRGNGIHLFDSDSLVVTGNRVQGARDGIYISATNDSFFDGNEVSDQRFGIHYMFSQRNTLRDNISRNNNSAFALMQSSDLIVTGNRAEGSREHGILFRDAQRCVIRGNVVVGNAEGLFLYSSTENEITGNRVENNDVGAKIWAGSVRNRIHDNAFVGNRCQVFYVSASDLELGVGEDGNYWSDYLGWDQDGDGVGDRPYRVDSFTSGLLFRFPSAVLLLRSPSLELLAHLQERLPFLRVATVVDHSPLVHGGS
jgi:nitrous oxidase accessory protein